MGIAVSLGDIVGYHDACIDFSIDFSLVPGIFRDVMSLSGQDLVGMLGASYLCHCCPGRGYCLPRLWLLLGEPGTAAGEDGRFGHRVVHHSLGPTVLWVLGQLLV